MSTPAPVTTGMNPAQPIPVGNFPGGSGDIANRSTVYGFGLRETTGTAAARVDVYNGNDTGGILIAPIDLNPGQSVRDVLGPSGVGCDMGVFVNIVSGSVAGSIWVDEL